MRAPAKALPESIGQYFYYDETSPSCLRWKISRYATIGKGPGQRLVVSKGDVAGHLRKDGYWTVKLFGEGIKIHRIIYSLHNTSTEMEGVIIDHENGDNTDNKIGNLKPSSDYSNGKNKGKYKSNSTGTTGVHPNEKAPGQHYYVATWREADKSIGAKGFSVNKYGAAAFTLACAYREAQLNRLKAEGMEYTERHGT